MQEVIIYEQGDGTIAVVMPAPNSGLTIEQVAAKDIPAGARWRIVDDLPDAPQEQWRWSDSGLPTVSPPAPPPVPQNLSFAHLMIGLVAEQWITESEGEAWLAGTLPAPVLGLIATLPAEQQFPAKARALRPSEVLRNDPLVNGMGQAAGKTPEEIDDFFRTYAQV
jgi:hypothetical protein